MTLTINIPEESVNRFQAVANARGLDVPAFLIDAANDAVNAAQEFEPDPKAVEGTRRGLKAIEDGDVMSLESYEVELASERRRRHTAAI